MIPLTNKLPAICSLLRRVLEMEETITPVPWKATTPNSGRTQISGPKGIPVSAMWNHTETSKSNADFIALSRNITKPQATALLGAIDALKTQRLAFHLEGFALGEKLMNERLQSIADAFPDALFQDSSRCA